MERSDISIVRAKIDPLFMREADTLMEDYYAATEAKTDLPPYEFNWSIYAAAQLRGELLCVAAMHFGEVVGFLMYVVHRHPHHMHHIWAVCDTLSVALHARGMKLADDMMSFAEPILREMNVCTITHNERMCYGKQGSLFTRHGFHAADVVYVKHLKGAS
jgi:hypothetical protein